MIHPVRLFALLFFFVMAGTALALGPGFGAGGLGGSGGGEPFKARAVPAAQPFTPDKEGSIIVEVTIDRRYHIQSAYQPKGSFNIATTVDPKPVPGLSFGPGKFPVSKDIPPPGGLTTEPPIPVYEGTIYIQIPVKVQSGAEADVTVEIVLEAQACDDKSCLPPKRLTLKVPVKIAPAGTAQTTGDPALVEAAGRQAYATPPAISASTTTAPQTQAMTPVTTGVALLSNEQQLALIAERPYKPFNGEEQNYPLGIIVVLALLGGIILNVMPCVLPVIPLKVLSLVQQAHGDRRLAVMHALAFSAGVIALFVALAVVLKTFGLFYGQQFQSPVFLITMALLVVALALSMLGVWTINPPNAVYSLDSARGGYSGAFANGLMATLLATPCSAPYLGPVFAWAFTQPAWLTAGALGLVGVGMSLPYLVLAAFPALLNRLPKAGRWSELLKQGLGIIMIGVSIYLITLLPNVTHWPWVLLGSVVVGLVCWAWGQIPTGAMSSVRIWSIRGSAIGLGVVLGGAIMVLASQSKTIMIPDQTGGEWQPFNVALLDAALKENRPVVVDWTANWCINCRALEAAVLSREAVRKEFADSRALLLRADLTSDNPPATALNQKLGSESIPVLAIFAPSRPYSPVVLRDSYTTTRVIEEVARAK